MVISSAILYDDGDDGYINTVVAFNFAFMAIFLFIDVVDILVFPLCHFFLRY